MRQVLGRARAYSPSAFSQNQNAVDITHHPQSVECTLFLGGVYLLREKKEKRSDVDVRDRENANVSHTVEGIPQEKKTKKRRMRVGNCSQRAFSHPASNQVGISGLTNVSWMRLKRRPQPGGREELRRRTVWRRPPAGIWIAGAFVPPHDSPADQLNSSVGVYSVSGCLDREILRRPGGLVRTWDPLGFGRDRVGQQWTICDPVY